ncbi:hypothetical protein GS492_25200, partial [Rhodococcus hoagii]|nr:hypothetical protein [Prescottella equi]
RSSCTGEDRAATGADRTATENASADGPLPGRSRRSRTGAAEGAATTPTNTGWQRRPPPRLRGEHEGAARSAVLWPNRGRTAAADAASIVTTALQQAVAADRQGCRDGPSGRRICGQHCSDGYCDQVTTALQQAVAADRQAAEAARGGAETAATTAAGHEDAAEGFAGAADASAQAADTARQLAEAAAEHAQTGAPAAAGFVSISPRTFRMHCRVPITPSLVFRRRLTRRAAESRSPGVLAGRPNHQTWRRGPWPMGTWRKR